MRNLYNSIIKKHLVLVCLFIMVFMGTLSLSAKGTDLKVETIKCNTKCSSSFAIFIDSKSFM
ncbi:MAG: hypothetical protein Q4B21_05110, partial [Bacteroidia bacterium]|nr:hypothetical protein [Bacteroidia bacterium]